VGRQVGHRGLYLNDYWSQLLPWNQEKYDKAKYFVTGNAMSSSVPSFLSIPPNLKRSVDAVFSEYGWVKYPVAYGKAMNLSRKLRDEYDELFKQFDVIVMPTVTQPARRHIPISAGPLAWDEIDRESHASITLFFASWLFPPRTFLLRSFSLAQLANDLAAGISSNTAASNLTGHPTMTIPVGWTLPMAEDIHSPEDKDIRLPVGMMIMGKLFDEATVLRVGDAWEQAFDWKEQI
jgi:amidase